jgi:hypothetical protein
MSSNRRSKQVGNVNYIPDFIKALDNSASKIASCYGFATTASLHKTYSTDPSFQLSRDVIDQFATDSANSFGHPKLIFAFLSGFDNAQNGVPLSLTLRAPRLDSTMLPRPPSSILARFGGLSD